MTDIRLSGFSLPYTAGTTANRPAAPAEGTQYFNTTIGGLQVYINGQWATHQKPTDIVAPSGATATNQGSGRAFNNGQASIAFTPSELGGLATGYTVTSTPGSYTQTGTSSPILITGLQSSTSYTYTVAALNSYSSATSSASSTVTATTVPDAPTIDSVTNGISQVSIAFTAGATGGSSITEFTVTSSPGNLTTTGASSPLVVTGLTNGTAYTFTATATNANGTSAASLASSSITAASVFNDDFNRTTSGSLGTSSSGGFWNAVRGVWSANGSQATSSDAASTYPLATVAMSSPDNTLKVGTSMGVGLAYWSSGAGDWWATVPVSTSATENFSTCTSNACCSTTAKTCYYPYGFNTNQNNCINNAAWFHYSPQYYSNGLTTCIGTFTCYLNDIQQYGPNAACCGTQCVSSSCCTGSPNNTRTRYYWALRVIKAIGDIFTTQSEVAISNSLTNSNSINSVKTVTTGDSLVATAHSDTAAVTQIGSSISIASAGAVRANGVGIIKTPSTNNQGSTADNFAAN